MSADLSASTTGDVGRTHIADTYYSASAQEDNLGDSVIRRIALGWIPSDGRTVHVYIGNMSGAYVDVVAAGRPDLRLYRSSRLFFRSWAQSTAGRRAAVVFAPGPRNAGRSLAETGAAGRALLMTGATRMAGGPVITVGGALSGIVSPALVAHRLSARLETHHSVRDPHSQRLLRAGVLVPDVAFSGADPAPSAPERPVLAISLRADREIDDSALTRLVVDSRALGIEPVLVTQVRRDESFHDEIAARLRLRHVAWAGRTHGEQLLRLEEVYREAAAVYSNRLHVCIFAARHGAVVLNAETRPAGKVASTLGAVYGPDAVGPLGIDNPTCGALQRWDEVRPEFARATRLAAEAVLAEGRQVTAVLAATSSR